MTVPDLHRPRRWLEDEELFVQLGLKKPPRPVRQGWQEASVCQARKTENKKRVAYVNIRKAESPPMGIATTRPQHGEDFQGGNTWRGGNYSGITGLRQRAREDSNPQPPDPKSTPEPTCM